MENNNIEVRVSDPRTIMCLKRLSEYEPRPYTKFLLSKPVHQKGQWGVRSYVDYELAEKDAAIVIMLKKGLSVDESNYALWSVAKLLLEASAKAKAVKKKMEEVTAREAGGVSLAMLWIKRAFQVIAHRLKQLFNAPSDLHSAIKRLIQRKK